ncbi:MAG: cytochrome c [Limibacillus sp.]
MTFPLLEPLVLIAMMRPLLLSALASVVFALPVRAEPDGQALYLQHCASCHGAALEGEPDWRTRKPDGKLPAPPHDESGHTWHHPDPQLFAITKYGIEALVPNYASDMGGYEEILSDQEIWAVLDYIKSQWPEEVRKQRAEITARAAQQ